MAYTTDFSLYDVHGQRKYLNRLERKRFFICTQDLPLEKKILCQLIYFTGARISEVMELHLRQIDFADQSVIFRTLKQRKEKIVYRLIPVPMRLMGYIRNFIEFAQVSEKRLFNLDERLLSFSVRSASRYIKSAMICAEIKEPRSCARGLRHGFAVHTISRGVPLTQLQIWMGHADIKTTAIYLQVSGMQEREWAQRLWDEEET